MKQNECDNHQFRHETSQLEITNHYMKVFKNQPPYETKQYEKKSPYMKPDSIKIKKKQFLHET